MKREEMLLKIEEVIKKLSGNTPIVRLADSILKEIESAGMLPPSKRLSFEEYNAMAYVIDSKSQYKEVHKWEE